MPGSVTVKPERDESYPGRTIERVHLEPLRQERLHGRRLIGPVQEGQILPTMEHHRTRNPNWWIPGIRRARFHDDRPMGLP